MIADIANHTSQTDFNGSISVKGGGQGGDGGFVETSASHFTMGADAKITAAAPRGKSGTWLIDPYDYTIDAPAATVLVDALANANVIVTTTVDNSAQGSTGTGSGNINVNAPITSSSGNRLTLTAASSIIVNAPISVGSLVLNAPTGISLGANMTTRTDMTLNGNVSLLTDVTLTSGISHTYVNYTDFIVPTGVTSISAILVGGAGGQGGDDGGNTGGDTGRAGRVIASFNVTAGEHLYLAPGRAGVDGGDSIANTGGAAGGTNAFGLASGGSGGNAGPGGYSGGGAGGGAATILSRTAAPTLGSSLLLAGGAGGGGGSGNNAACPSLCAGQSAASYVSGFTGGNGPHSGNRPGGAIDDGGGSGGGGGGLSGGAANASVFFVNEWTGRGGNAGSSGAANGFATTSLVTSSLARTNGAAGYATISYGGGTVAINGTVDGGRALSINSVNGDIAISGSVGGVTSLSALNLLGTKGIALSGAGVTTTGAQSYTGNLTLNAATTSMTSGSGGVTLGGDVLKGTGAGNLSLNTGAGAAAFNGAVGLSSSPLGTLSITSTGITTFSGAVHAQSLTKAGSGQTNILGGLVRTSGGQSYGGRIDLGGDTQLTSTGSGDITVSGAISNSNQSNLSVSANGGNIALLGSLAIGTNARPTPIGDVTLTASGTVSLGSAGARVSAAARSLSVNAASLNVYADTSTNFTCGTGNGTGICVTDSTSVTVANAGNWDGPLSGRTSLTKSGNGKLSLTGNTSISGNIAVTAGILEIGGSGSLGTADGSGNYVYAGNINVGTGQLRIATSQNEIFTGTMSGATASGGFINSPGTGSLDIVNATALSAAHADRYGYFMDIYFVAAAGQSSTYGDTPNVGYTLRTAASGGSLVSDAGSTGAAVLASGGQRITATSHAGTYSATYDSGLTIGNERYTLLAGPAVTWTVAPRALNISAVKTYDGSGQFGAATISLSNLVNGDAAPALTGSLTVASANAATYSSATANNLSTVNTNYTLSGGTISATINRAHLTVTADNQSRLYGQANPAFTQTITGFVNGEGLGVVSGSAVGNSTANAATGIGSYAITGNVSGLTAANYYFTAANGTLTVNRAHLTVTAGNQSRLYGQANPAFTQTITGFVNGEGLGVVSGSATASSTASAASNAASYVISAGLGTLSAANYDFTAVDGALTVHKAPLTITALDAAKTYDGLAYSGGNGVQYSGFVNGESAAVLGGVLGYAGSSQGAMDAGQYVLKPIGQTSGNYDIQTVNGALTVAKASATITADSRTVTYNGLAQSVTGFTATGLVNGETTSVLTGLAVRGSAKDAGRYAVTLSGSAANYNLAFVDGLLVINKANAVVTAGSANRIYNGQVQSVTGYTATGLINGEAVSVLSDITTQGGSGKDAGRYVLTASGSDRNYNLTFTDGVLTINPAQALVIANSDSVFFNGQTQSVTGFTATGLVGADTAAALTGVTTSGGQGRDAGNYVLAAQGRDRNYTLTFVDGVLQIKAVPLTVLTPGSDAVPVTVSTVMPLQAPSGGLPSVIDTSVVSGPANVAPDATVLTAGLMGNADTGAASTTGGIEVSLDRSSPGSLFGMVMVTAPKTVVAAGRGFSFQLPQEVRGVLGDSQAQATKANGEPLPDWIRFHPATRTFEISGAPDTGLPLDIMVMGNGTQVQLTISERTA